MADRKSSTVTRTITVSDLTPAELASIFAQFSDHEQAQFFDAVGEESKDWPGSGWEQQACSICASDSMTSRGRNVIRALAEFVEDFS